MGFSCALLLILASAATAAHAQVFERSSHDAAPQFCGTDLFYCPYDMDCKPRLQRCIGSDICKDPNTENEDKCDCDGNSQRCNVYRGKSPILSSRRVVEDLQHHFIDYKGFTFEFGSYGIQILDRNEPASPFGYRYDREKVSSYRFECSSQCTYQQALDYANWFRRERYYLFFIDYNIVFKNCQDFANGLRNFLCGNKCQSTSKTIPESYYEEITPTECVQDDAVNLSGFPTAIVLLSLFSLIISM